MIYRQNLHGLLGDFLFPAMFHKDIQNNAGGRHRWITHAAGSCPGPSW